MKRIVLLFLMVSWANKNAGLERRNGVLTRTQLRAQHAQEWQGEVQEWRTQERRSGMRTILEYAPIVAVGACLYINSLYRKSNSEQKCWVQTPSVTQEECDLLKQCTCGLILCIAPSWCIAEGCGKLCESKICHEENCCSECCTLCVQECCGLLRGRYTN